MPQVDRLVDTAFGREEEVAQKLQSTNQVLNQTDTALLLCVCVCAHSREKKGDH